jgi:hypothetical protein
MTKARISHRSGGDEKFNVEFPDDLKVSPSFPSRLSNYRFPIEAGTGARAQSLTNDCPLSQPNWVLILSFVFVDLWVIKHERAKRWWTILQCLQFVVEGNEKMVMHLITGYHLCPSHNADLTAPWSSSHSLSICHVLLTGLFLAVETFKCLLASRQTNHPFPELYYFTCIVTSYCVNRLRHQARKV